MANQSSVLADKKAVPPVRYSDDELKYRGVIIRELQQAFAQRQQRFAELDDMTYDEFYVSNKKAANAYIPPKINNQDYRTVSGTTREKKNTLLSSLLNYNLEADVDAFDKDELPLTELGQTLESFLKKSRIVETPDYEVKRPLFYGELIDQGTAFIRERILEYQMKSKKLDDMNFTEPMKATWKTKLEDLEQCLDSELIPGPNVYLGNIREYYIELQPYIGVRREITRAEAESLYGTWERWNNVPYTIVKSIPTQTLVVSSISRPYDDWSMVEVTNDMVEEVMYYNKWRNEYMILLNGVMMMPIGFPLESILGKNEYPIAKGDIEPISRFFAYSRSVPAKTKVNQAIFDEMLKAIVLKTRKSYQPPLANNTGQTLSQKVFYPGTVHDNIDPDKLKPIGDNNGVTPADYQAIEFIKGIIDESSVSPVFEGNSSKGQQTAREVMELKNQSMMKLGLTILGVINLEKKMAWLRLCTILKYWTQEYDKKIEDTKGQLKTVVSYRTISVESEFENGQKGTKIINMTKDDLPHPDQIMAREDILSKRRGTPIRMIYLNPEELANLRYTFFISINPTQKDTNELRAAVFQESLTQAVQMFGPWVNMDNAREIWAAYNQINADKFFLKQPQGMPGQPGMPGQGDPSQGGVGPLQSQMQAPQPPGPMKPSLNTLAGAA